MTIGPQRTPLRAEPRMLAAWLAPESVCALSLLRGWHSSVFKVELKDGAAVVLRVHAPEDTPDAVSATLAVIDAVAEHLPEVPVPILTRGGQRSAGIEDRCATLWPFIEGSRADRARRSHRTAAAGLLARIHIAAGLMPDRTDHPANHPWVQLDWARNRWWHWAATEQFLRSADRTMTGEAKPEDLLDAVRQGMAEMLPSLRALAHAGLPSIPLHGDFYPGNLIMRGARVVGVIDWDDTRLDWRAWDVAQGVLEFCAEDAGVNLDRDAALAFLDSYVSAGGEITPAERAALPLLMRARKLYEMLFDSAQAARGHVDDDWRYINRSARSLRDMSSLAL